MIRNTFDSASQHPHMLVVGLYDGNIAVYNLQKNTGTPSYQSDAKNGKHRDIVWQVILWRLSRNLAGQVGCRQPGRLPQLLLRVWRWQSLQLDHRQDGSMD